MDFRKGIKMYKNELEVDIARCLHALVKKIWFILIMAALFFMMGFGYTINIGEDRYSAYATVYAAADGSYVDAANAVTAMNAYLNVASSYKVSQRAALLMGRANITGEDVKNSTSVNSSSTRSETSTASFMNSSATIITFYATTNDPDLSMEMADAMAQSYALEMNEILDKDSVKMLDNAVNAEVSYNAKMAAWRTRIIAAAAGFLLACILVVACEIFDSKVRTVREATIKNAIPIIGIIPDNKD